jgi:hypothetical protein
MSENGENVSNSGVDEGDPVAAVATTAAAIQEAVDQAEDKGYFGESPDKTPRENYSVSGVLAGKPTPEFVELEHKD